DPSVRHQRQKKMPVLHHVRPDVAPLLHDLIMQGPRRALGTRQRQWTKLEGIGTARFPRTATSIAVDACGQPAARSELDAVLSAVVWRQRRPITALELDELPRCVQEVRTRLTAKILVQPP